MYYPHQSKGALAGIAAGIFWGTPFLVPIVLEDFSAFEIMFGRFMFFGLLSLFYIKRIVHLLQGLNKKALFQIFLLSAAGYWLYTLVLFWGIKLSGGVVSSLIMGCMPLSMTLFSKPNVNLRLISGLLFILIGICFLLLPPLLQAGHKAPLNIPGILLIFTALSLWTWFGLYNSRFMQEHPHIKALDYSSTMGVVSLVIVWPFFIFFQDFNDLFHHPQMLQFFIGCAILGIGASWLANVLWTYCAKNCPNSILGALLSSETLFALLYSFIYEGRLPFGHEYLAMLTLILGVFFVVVSQTRESALA